jgi:hypothetical protein
VSEPIDVEQLLRRAFAPVEPPEELSESLERRLETISELAADELESWELAAMRDPRNWVRPAAAVVAGTGAGAALVLLRVRARKRPTGVRAFLDETERTLRDAAEQARKLAERQ